MTACLHLLLQLLLELGEPGIWAQHWNILLITRISANLILVNEAGLQSQGCTWGTMGDRFQSSGCALRCPWGSCAQFRAPCPVGNLCPARSEGNPREKLLFQQVENISFAFLQETSRLQICQWLPQVQGELQRCQTSRPLDPSREAGAQTH